MGDLVEKLGTPILTSVGVVAAGLVAAYVEALTAAGRRKRALEDAVKTLGFVESWLKVRQQVKPEMDEQARVAVTQALDDVFRRAVVAEAAAAAPPTGLRRLLLLYSPSRPWRWAFQLPFYFAVTLLIFVVAGGVLQPSLLDGSMAVLLLVLLAVAAVFRFGATWRGS